jgi:hypothetical protein
MTESKRTKLLVALTNKTSKASEKVQGAFIAKIQRKSEATLAQILKDVKVVNGKIVVS